MHTFRAPRAKGLNGLSWGTGDTSDEGLDAPVEPESLAAIADEVDLEISVAGLDDDNGNLADEEADEGSIGDGLDDIRGNKQNPFQSEDGNILVAVRVRPLPALTTQDMLPLEEDYDNPQELVKVMGKKIVVLMDPTYDKADFLRAKRSREKRYAFDYAFNKTASQKQVYQKTTQFLINGVLDGFNATVFAYGATGAGKTHTMLGTITQPGTLMTWARAWTWAA